MSDVFVYYVKLPPGINEMVTPCPDDAFTVYIDERLSDQKKIEAYQHALNHINSNDWAKDDVQEIETVAHGAPDPVQQEHVPNLITELLRRHKKSMAARKKKLDRIAKRYAEMSPAEIYEHNEKMIARRDEQI